MYLNPNILIALIQLTIFRALTSFKQGFSVNQEKYYIIRRPRWSNGLTCGHWKWWPIPVKTNLGNKLYYMDSGPIILVNAPALMLIAQKIPKFGTT